MAKALKLFSFIALLSISSYGQVDEDYSKALTKMFEVSGTEETYQSVTKQMFSMFKQQYANVDVKIWKELEQDFAKTSINDLTEMLAPIYAKYMTKGDLEAMIEFYQSPVGIKFAKNTPFIMQESMQVGQQWGMKIGEDFAKKMKERGY